MKSIEAAMVHEAEIALSLTKQGDEAGHNVYREILTYEKRCTIADCGISEATWRNDSGHAL
jgi:hypothetical protein